MTGNYQKYVVVERNIGGMRPTSNISSIIVQGNSVWWLAKFSIIYGPEIVCELKIKGVTNSLI